MTDMRRAERPLAASGPGRHELPWAVAALAGLALAATAGAPRAQDMTLNSTTEAYRQRAVEGARRHDFSPTTPPRNGRFIYGHWTPYDPPHPDSLPATARRHVIASGDTLWGISQQHYRDPLLWPFLWEANSWITYPHWIYPGDVLLVPDFLVIEPGTLEEEVASFPGVLEAFYPAGAYGDVHCGHFLVSPNRKWFGEIVDQENDPAAVTLTLEDVVYVNVGEKDGVLPGDEFAIIHPRQHFDITVNAREKLRSQVQHPVTGEKLGYVMQMVGRLKIILLGEAVSTARITFACDSIEIGYDLVPFTEIPVPLVRRHEREKYFNEMAERGRGFVVWAKDMQVISALGSLVSIDLGSNHGVLPGDVFRIYRDFPSNFYEEDTDHLGDFWDYREGVRRMKRRKDPAEVGTFGRERRIPATPPRVIGELVVLYTERDSATARVTYNDKEVIAGDRIVYLPLDTGLTLVPRVAGPTTLVPDIPLHDQAHAPTRGAM